MTLHLILIADPNSMRANSFCSELSAYDLETGRNSRVTIIDWEQVCVRGGRISDLLPDQPAILRIESPARDFGVIQALIKAGETAAGLSPSEWNDGGHGWIASPLGVFEGLCACLSGIEETLIEFPHIISPARPRDIATLFDKNLTSACLRQWGIPVPPYFHPDTDLNKTISVIRQQNWPTAFVKLAHGSCASGIVVLDSSSVRLQGITTVVRKDGLFYNTFDVRHVSGREARDILEFILSQNATIQQAIPKAQVNGQNFDLRVVVLNRTVIAVIARVSQHPMTNLHLGGTRGDVHAIRNRVGQRRWLDAMDLCTEAAAGFELPCVGVDIAFDRATRTPCILEINAFGDFFPNWTNDGGKSVHRLQIEYFDELWGNMTSA